MSKTGVSNALVLRSLEDTRTWNNLKSYFRLLAAANVRRKAIYKSENTERTSKIPWYVT